MVITLTFIMAAVGCAVGFGNIWLFPYTAGSSGGSAFVLIYLAAMIGLALPVLIVELMVGRRGAAAPPQASPTWQENRDAPRTGAGSACCWASLAHCWR